MQGERAERFVVANCLLLAAGFFAAGVLMVAFPDDLLGVLDDFGDLFGDFAPAPETNELFWLGLGFAYMMVITGICLVVSTDVVRYRPLLLVLAAGKAASSLSTLGFFLFDDDVFPYLLNFLVDGFLVGAALFLWLLAGRVGAPAAPS